MLPLFILYICPTQTKNLIQLIHEKKIEVLTYPV